MMKKWLGVLVIVLALFGSSIALAQAPPTGHAAVDTIVGLLEKLSALAPILLLLGAGWKFLPVVKGWINEIVIPVGNALILFFTAFAPPAQAGIFSGVGIELSGLARAMGALLASAAISLLHDKFIKPATPPSPYRLEQLKKAA